MSFLLLRSANTACSFPAPANPSLPSALRSLGGFDQAMDAADPATLQSASVTAATALHPDLIGVSAASVVREQASGAGPSALVVPLQRREGTGRQVVALVAYLTDCTGRPFFDAVDDRSQAPVAAYPSPAPQRTAKLEFSGDPFSPFWN